MSILSHKLKWLAGIICSTFLLLVCLLAFLLLTTPGIYCSAKIANLFLPGKLSISKAEGALAKAFSIQKLHYEDTDLDLTLQQVTIKWRLSGLLGKYLSIRQVNVKQADVRIKSTSAARPDSETDTETGAVLQMPSLPLSFEIKSLNIAQLNLIQGNSTQGFDNIHTSMQYRDNLWDISSFKIENKDLKLELSLKTLPQHPEGFEADLSWQSRDDSSLPPISGLLHIQSDGKNIQWQGGLSKPSKLQIKGNLKQANDLDSSIRWKQFQWPLAKNLDLKTNAGMIQIGGNLKQPQFHLQTTLEAPKPGALDIIVNQNNNTSIASLKFKGEGSDIYGKLTHSQTIKGELEAKIDKLEPMITGLEQVHINAELKGNNWNTIQLHAQINAQYMQQPFQASLDYKDNKFWLSIHMADNKLIARGVLPFPWTLEADIPSPEKLHPTLKALKTSLKGKAVIQGASDATLTLDIAPGHYQLPEEQQMPDLAFKGGQIHFKLNQKELSGNALISIDDSKKLEWNFNAPGFNLNQGLNPQQSINSKLVLNINSLNFLNALSKDISSAQGRFSMNLTSTGTFATLKHSGRLSLENASFQLPNMGINLTQGQAQLSTQNQQWQLNASIHSNQRQVAIQGSGVLHPQFSGNLSVKGQEVEVLATDDYQIFVSPDLSINIADQKTIISGSLLIPKALISPKQFTESISLSDDVIFSTEEEQIPNKFSMNIDIRMGDEVKLDLKGLKGLLKGNIIIRQQTQGPLSASGNLHIEQGLYKAYGQELIISQGDLFFGGGAISNPGIDLRAVRKFSNSGSSFSASNQMFDFNASNLHEVSFNDNVTVGIEVSGRINNPVVKLFSNPSGISQADILSMLLLGRPIGQADQSGAQLLIAAISALDLNQGTEGTQLLDQMQKSLGLDFSFLNNSSYNSQTNSVNESQSISVGKSLTKRIYISYNVGLMQNNANVITLKYLLNKFFSVQVTASDEGSGIDFLYTRQRN